MALLVVWSLADSSRYLFYAAKPLTSLYRTNAALAAVRYSAFVVLYPVGYVLELALHLEYFNSELPSPPESSGLPVSWQQVMLLTWSAVSRSLPIGIRLCSLRCQCCQAAILFVTSVHDTHGTHED